MHLDHDETMHEHVHTHADGTTHSHAHPHHEDLSDHEQHTHANLHSDENYNCADCGHEHDTTMEELKALLNYMVGHNTAHAEELKELAGKLLAKDENAAAADIMLAVRDFEKANQRLSDVLAALNG